MLEVVDALAVQALSSEPLRRYFPDTSTWNQPDPAGWNQLDDPGEGHLESRFEMAGPMPHLPAPGSMAGQR